jgi:flagellar biosynthesis protein FlhG
MTARILHLPDRTHRPMTTAATPDQDNAKRPTVIAVASGKGGVGKTHVSVNLAVALARSGKRVMLFDADMGLANAGVMLGVPSRHTLEDVMSGRMTLAEIVQPGPGGVGLVSGGSGDATLVTIDEGAQADLCSQFAIFRDDLDYLVIDTAAGIAPMVTSFIEKADMAVVVLCDEPASFIDAYGLLKALNLRGQCREAKVVTNMVANELAGRQLFDRFRDVAGKFLPTALDHIGSVPMDPHIRRAARAKRCVVDSYPTSLAAQAFARLGQLVERRTLSGASAFDNPHFFKETGNARAA